MEEDVSYPLKVTVGYMLKVLKSGVDTYKFRREFAAIRHGNYEEFIELVKGRIPFMVIYGQEEGKRLFDFAGRPICSGGCDYGGGSLRLGGKHEPPDHATPQQ